MPSTQRSPISLQMIGRTQGWLKATPKKMVSRLVRTIWIWVTRARLANWGSSRSYSYRQSKSSSSLNEFLWHHDTMKTIGNSIFMLLRVYVRWLHELIFEILKYKKTCPRKFGTTRKKSLKIPKNVQMTPFAELWMILWRKHMTELSERRENSHWTPLLIDHQLGNVTVIPLYSIIWLQTHEKNYNMYIMYSFSMASPLASLSPKCW
jgi:hypothetical protein